MSNDRGVKKGDKFIAGGTATVFKVDSVKDGFVTLKEDVSARPKDEDPEPEVVTTSIDNLFEQDDWKGAED